MTDLVIALDVPSRRDAAAIVERLGPRADFYKVGLQLFTAEGPAVVHWLRALGKRVFLDLKLHDIPNTVAGAVRAAADLEVELLTIHAAGGVEMMRAAQEAAREVQSGDASTSRLRLLAVTVLTSLTVPQLDRVWGAPALDAGMDARVLRLARAAQDAGLDGLVCSPLELELLRAELGADWYLLTPGIRLEGQERGDQARVVTPAKAVAWGSSALVLGRAVTSAPDPPAALDLAREAVAGVEHQPDAIVGGSF
ncbi:MAG: orotidine-5'-phosphate decarboxylase [Gemmatimonadota bacterium]